VQLWGSSTRRGAAYGRYRVGLHRGDIAWDRSRCGIDTVERLVLLVVFVILRAEHEASSPRLQMFRCQYLHHRNRDSPRLPVSAGASPMGLSLVLRYGRRYGMEKLPTLLLPTLQKRETRAPRAGIITSTRPMAGAGGAATRQTQRRCRSKLFQVSTGAPSAPIARALRRGERPWHAAEQ
jgi:hypothetical protein